MVIRRNRVGQAQGVGIGAAVGRYRLCLLALAVVGLFVVGPGALTAQAAAKPSFSTDPALEPGFGFAKRDYVIRCTAEPVAISVRAPGKWQGKVGAGSFRSGTFTVERSLSAGEAFTVTFRRRGHATERQFHTRCLPAAFPDYEFTRTAPGGPKLFSVQLIGSNYAVIFNRDGVPVWWFDVGSAAFIAEVLPDGTFALGPAANIGVQTGTLPIYSLTGRLIRTIKGANGLEADLHELQLLPNGNYLIFARLPQEHVDTTPYGGSSVDDTVIGAEVQELTPSGKLVWKWDSDDYITIEETVTRWWTQILGLPVLHNDIVHMNAIEPAGKHLLLSFRHLDAVYKISRRTGNIVWKLGGTPTPKSLTVRNDPYPDPLGGQHDVRLQPDGTITIYDNQTGLGGPPRSVRFRINERARTARLVESVSDPAVSDSPFMGGTRRLPSGDWLTSWGGTPYVGAYDSNGKRLFSLRTPESQVASYRATPVPPGAASITELRRAMNVLSHR